MEIDAHLDALESEGRALARIARDADLDAVVSHCPGWTVRDVVTHVGGVHRWATDIVADARNDPDSAAAAAVGSGPADDGLVEWFGDGHAGLVRTLRAAPRDLACFTFLPAQSPLAFWARRQALETAVHRVDGEAAVGPVTPIDVDLALDGIDEILFGFGARPKRFAPGVLRLEPDAGTGWDVTLGTEGLTAGPMSPSAAMPDATVSGGASEVYLWLWNRPAAVSITGDRGVADQWKTLRIRWA